MTPQIFRSSVCPRNWYHRSPDPDIARRKREGEELGGDVGSFEKEGWLGLGWGKVRLQAETKD